MSLRAEQTRSPLRVNVPGRIATERAIRGPSSRRSAECNRDDASPFGHPLNCAGFVHRGAGHDAGARAGRQPDEQLDAKSNDCASGHAEVEGDVLAQAGCPRKQRWWSFVSACCSSRSKLEVFNETVLNLIVVILV